MLYVKVPAVSSLTDTHWKFEFGRELRNSPCRKGGIKILVTYFLGIWKNQRFYHRLARASIVCLHRFNAIKFAIYDYVCTFFSRPTWKTNLTNEDLLIIVHDVV